ncbi:Eco57I restriction-modification methylase domain-containing protein [Mesoflavibacter profundi]|uniref:Eco57I restriction-modification methylase domain-containing protein n=1 Tax=Mesoflavibacter profundi TaxID=2708110 RepID=UPI00168AE06A|nr:DNA methyltransferase [Mesoflavibacter profundi]
MSLYQPSVLKHYLKLQDSEAINKAYTKYKRYFLNPTIQDNIRSSKEEEYQGIFLTELFVNVLDYTLKPKANFNLVAEYKNQNNARKADGAILDNDIAIGVIELKGTNTKDLESIRKQAFDYKANQKGCVYVITSNFEKLRFYINDATEFEEFNLFELTPERFELLYICLQKDNVLNNTPLKIKEQSVVEEEQITKQFYKDYSLFKRELFRDLVKRNAKTLKSQASNDTSSAVERSQEELLEVQRLEKNVKLTLFKKSQKLIDRYLFIFFAEDRGLLPPNSTQQILDKWKADVDFGDDRPLYVLFKQYFNFLDTGRAGTTKRAEIYAYNGGLFKEDKTLDSLDIDSDLLYKHTSKLAAYDFESQVDVNILGHIFENSLNEIESVNAEIEGADFDKQKSKRKKDGVFYTPKYITKYIVENTVGKLCEEKKTKLGFKEEEYFKGRKNRQKATITKLVDILDTYRDWLLQLTICDPACGSGAFLNQALNFLIAEHQYIDELKTKVLGGGLQFPDIENTILENNIYGVDLNEESVEIAKLSLWLRTAQPRRKLNDLSNNIKCGNSLIDSKAVAGDKAFNWQEQFPKVFENGGFDVIIGNPPYVRQELFKDHSEYLKKYNVYSGKADLFTYFFEKANNLLKTNGYLSFICSGKFFEANYGKPLVKYLVKNFVFQEVINFDDLEVFEGISAYPLIFTGVKKTPSINYHFKFCFIPDYVKNKISEIVSNIPFSKVNINDFVEFDYNFYDTETANVFKKINRNSIYLNDLNLLPLVGVKTGFNEGFMSKENTVISRPYIFGKNIKRFLTPLNENKIIFPYVKKENLYQLMNEDEIINNKHLEHHREKLERRAIIKDGIKNGSKKWFEYQQINRKLDFEKEYIVYPNVSLGTNFTLSKGNVIDMTGFIIPSNDKFLLFLLNSKITKFVMNKIAISRRGGYNEYKVQYLSKIPLKDIQDSEKKKYREVVDIIVNNNDKLYNLLNKFQTYLKQKFKLEKLPKKLQNWHELEFGDFIKELNKAIKTNNKQRVKDSLEEVPTLTKKDEFEWLDLFEDNKQKAQALQTQINQTDKEIDAMVYELYGLTEEEIQIVENS